MTRAIETEPRKREYHRRPDAKRHTMSVPMSEELRDRVWALAADLRRTPTDIAREGIEQFVERCLEKAR